MNLLLLLPIFKNDLKKIDYELKKVCNTNVLVLNLAITHVIDSGGKKIRPIFVLLCAKFGNYNIEILKYAAVALEVVHVASLVHDDVIDCADTRRDEQTVAKKYGNKVATYTGDYMFAQAMQLISKTNNNNAHILMSETIIDVCIGELNQIKDRYNTNQSIRHYLKKIKRKTATLIAASCKLGAMTADAKEHIQNCLFMYGHYLGMSYQINDDILDFISTKKDLGKPVGHDLLHGNITLPVIYAMEIPVLKKKISTINEETSVSTIESIIKEIQASDSIIRAKKLSKAYANKAIKILDKIPDHPYKKYLHQIAKKMYNRSF